MTAQRGWDFPAGAHDIATSRISGSLTGGVRTNDSDGVEVRHMTVHTAAGDLPASGHFTIPGRFTTAVTNGEPIRTEEEAVEQGLVAPSPGIRVEHVKLQTGVLPAEVVFGSDSGYPRRSDPVTWVARAETFTPHPLPLDEDPTVGPETAEAKAIRETAARSGLEDVVLRSGRIVNAGQTVASGVDYPHHRTINGRPVELCKVCGGGKYLDEMCPAEQRGEHAPEAAPTEQERQAQQGREYLAEIVEKYRGWPDDDDAVDLEPKRAGVWIATGKYSGAIVPFAEEIDALRFAVQRGGMDVDFVEYGEQVHR
jgi:hypothetical protein